MLKIFLFLCIDHQIGTMEQPWLEEPREMRGIRCNLSFTVSFRKTAKESTPVWHLEIEGFNPVAEDGIIPATSASPNFVEGKYV